MNSSYEERIVIIIENKTYEKIIIQDSSLMKDKWHSDYNKDQSIAAIDDLSASPNCKIRINSCGTNEPADGTEVNFNIVDSDSVIIRSVHFNVPNDISEKKIN
jgi:hypothetical protein